MNKIIGFNAYKEQGKIEAGIERGIIIESKKYEEHEHSAVSDEILKDKIWFWGDEIVVKEFTIYTHIGNLSKEKPLWHLLALKES